MAAADKALDTTGLQRLWSHIQAGFGDLQAQINNIDTPTTEEVVSDGSITRSKLATDALYSPWKAIQGSIDITVADIGCTFKNEYGQTYELVISQANSTSMPEGPEIAAYAYGEAGAVLTIKSVGVRLLLDGDETLYPSGTTVRVAGANSMIALKKFLTSADNGDVWIITGNVEVAS